MRSLRHPSRRSAIGHAERGVLATLGNGIPPFGYQEIAELSRCKDVITALVDGSVARAHKAVPELEVRRAALIAERAALAGEKQNLSQWLLGAGLTTQSVAFINAQLDERTEKETRLQEQRWGIDDRLTELQTRTYSAQGIADQLRDFVRVFPDLDAGEKVLWMESLVKSVTVGEDNGVAFLLRPPLALGYLPTGPAPRGRRPQVPELRVRVEYSLTWYFLGGVSAGDRTRYRLAREPEPARMR